MRSTTPLNVAIDPAEKERWKRAADELHLSLRAFVRGAVEARIARDCPQHAPPADEPKS